MNALSGAAAALGVALIVSASGGGFFSDAPPAVTGLSAGHAPVTGPSASHAPAPADVPAATLTQVVAQYCQVCHNDALLTGNMSLSGFDVEGAAENAETAERMIRKLRAGMMPPPGMPRPGGDTLLALVETLENTIDDAARRDPNPGGRTFQRLNRAEYEQSVMRLLGLEVDAGQYLPLDTKSANFDNIADVQMLSPTLLEAYLNAASEISRLAIGDRDASPREVAYKVEKRASQLVRVDGTPYGSRGGISVTHTFPADGEYVFWMQFHGVGGKATDEKIEVSFDGERVAILDVNLRGGTENEQQGREMVTDPVFVRAGPRRVSAAFVKTFEGPVEEVRAPLGRAVNSGWPDLALTTVPHLREFAVRGPYSVTGVSETPSRQKIFNCRPTSPEEAPVCARSIFSRLASEAYRRPATQSDIADLMAFYDIGADEGGFERGVRFALQALLASPHFVFRFEEPPSGARAGEEYELDGSALASRLSFFLWGSPPDEELMEAARRGNLDDDDEQERQVRRMLADPRSDALSTRFASQWLRLQDLEKVSPDIYTFPYFDMTLSDAMMRETELFFQNLVREDRSLLEILTADYTFANERLAGHYGIPGIAGDDFQRVDYPDDRRSGLLGQGSILMLTSMANRTSPVLRGKWVMEVLLDAPPPPPPPDVPALEATEGTEEGKYLTTRQRMEKHRASPVCSACHQFMDPIGLALDNFDVTGEWRVREYGMSLDTRGTFYDGTTVASAGDLRDVLLKRPIPIVRAFTKNLMAYALGRRVMYYDQPTIREITREAEANDYRMSSFILGVVQSDAFSMKRTDQVLAEEPASN